MQNKIQLFSSLSIASAIIVPSSVLVSCNSNKIENIEMIDTKEYDGSDITPLSLGQQEWVNQEGATQAFIDAVTNDPSLFAKDMAYGASLRTREAFEEIYPKGVHLEIAEFGFSNPTFGKTNVWEDGFEDAEYHTISFKERVHLEYKFMNPAAESDFIRTLNLEISYENVIFLASEVLGGTDVDADHVWSIGIMDESLVNEAFWMYEYNSNPWCIKYGLSDETDRTLKGLEGAEDVHIHNCSYYSGTIDNSYKMYTLYHHARMLEMDQENITVDEKLQWHMIDTVLCIKQRSKLLSKLWNSPDVCLQYQLSQDYQEGGNKEFSGIHLINTKKPGYTVTSVKLNEDDQDKIVAKNISDPSKRVEIDPQQTLTNDYHLPYNLVGSGFGDAASFMLYRRQFKIQIEYSNTVTGQNKTLNTTLNLHYNTVKINFINEYKN